jgi:hypothetical protein
MCITPPAADRASGRLHHGRGNAAASPASTGEPGLNRYRLPWIGRRLTAALQATFVEDSAVYQRTMRGRLQRLMACALRKHP